MLLAIALVLALPLSFFPGSNVFSRVAVTFRIVDAATVSIDPWQGETNDISQRDGHYYSDKAPGVALIGVPPYALYKSLFATAGTEVDYQMARWFIRLLTLLPLCLIAAGIGRALLKRFDCPSDWFGPGWLFGTVAFPFSLVLFGHQFAACLILIAFFCLHTAKSRPEKKDALFLPILAGLCCGLSIISEYPSALLALFLGLYYLSFERRWPRLLAFALTGAVLPAIALAAYNTAAFGNPFSIGYHHLVDTNYAQGMDSTLLGVRLPTFDALWEITFSPGSGLFFTAPWLLFALPGLALMIFKKQQRAEGLLFLFSAISFFAFNAGYWQSDGAMSFGPRHLVPIVPFLALAAFRVAPHLGAAGHAVFFGTLVFSIALTAFGTYADPTMPDRLLNPLYEFALPILAGGFGLESPFGFVGAQLLALFAGILLLLWIALRSRTEPVRWNVLLGTITLGVAVYALVLPYVARTDPGVRYQVFANHHMKRKDFAQAERFYFKASQSRQDPYVHYYRGRALAHLGRVAEMQAEFEKALEIDPDFPHKAMLTRMLKGLSHEQ